MPHSEIHGSKLIRSSPRLFAAYHVLHRLCMPRHPLNALTTLDRSHCQCSSLLDLANPAFSLALEGSAKPDQTVRSKTRLPFTIAPIRCHRRVRYGPFFKRTRRACAWPYLKTSFSRFDPIPRGQATVIQPSVRCSPEGLQTTTTQSDKLPSYLRSLHHIRPARPSLVS